MPFVFHSSRISKARKKNDPSLRPVKSGLNKQEKQIFDIYMRALGGMNNDMNNSNVLRAIREAIEAGNPVDAAVAFQWEEFISSLNKVVPNLANQVASSANISAKDLPKRITIESNFTATDPRAIAWAQQRAGQRISGITKESQKAVAETIANGLRGGLTRDEVVTRLRKIVGLDARQAKALGAFYEKNLQQLLEEGYTYEEAVAEVTKTSEQYRQRLLSQRATRIARTETLAAANAGRMLSWGEADAQGILPADSLKRWKTATDERTCPVCKPMHNVAVPWQGAFSTGDVMPPAHPNCRCTAVIVPGTFTFEKNKERVIKQTKANSWLFVKHMAGKHDQKTHGSGSRAIQDELLSWSPLDTVPKSPKNAGSVPAKAWENWEHGPDGNQMFSLHRQFAGEELGLDVPKSSFDEGGYNHYLTQRGYGGSSLETSREHARAMLDAIENGRPQPALYRGIMEDEDNESSMQLVADLRNLEVGDSIDMPLVSTTRSLGVATLYSTDYGDKRSGQPILIKIQEGATGISQAPERSYYASDFEVITSGKFEVVSTGVVKAPFWERERITIDNRGDRATAWGDRKIDEYRDSTGAIPVSVYSDMYRGVTTGDFGNLVTESTKYTNSRGGQKISPNFQFGDSVVVERWDKQPEIEFKVIELKMIDKHRVNKAKTDFGVKFDILFANRVSNITPLEPLIKHAPGKHDQKTHGRGGMGAEWSKGKWHEMSDADYITFMRASQKLVYEDMKVAVRSSQGRELTEQEWEKISKTDAQLLQEKPTRVYKNGNIVVMSYPDESNSKYQSAIYEESLLRDIDDLQSLYPVDGLVLRISDKRIADMTGDNAYGATERGGQMMWLKGDALMPSKPNAGENNMPVANVVGVREYIITHEWGHLLDKAEYGGVADIGARESLVNNILNADYSESQGTPFMSGYGKTKTVEAYAESFVEYVVMKRAGATPSNPIVRAMAKKFGWDKPWNK